MGLLVAPRRRGVRRPAYVPIPKDFRNILEVKPAVYSDFCTALDPERCSNKRRIYLIRSQKVMLDSDLAGLYQVQTKKLNQAVKRNLDRFPVTLCFA